MTWGGAPCANLTSATIQDDGDRCCDALRADGLVLDVNDLEKIPRHADAIRLRAGELAHGSLGDAMHVYAATLRLLGQITDGLLRKIRLHDVGLLLSKMLFVE